MMPALIQIIIALIVAGFILWAVRKIIELIPMDAWLNRGYQSKMHIKCKDVFHLAWACGDAINLLREILPYLVVKQERAKIVLRLNIEYEEALSAAGGYFGNHHPLPDFIMASRLAAFAEMQRLNARGNHASY